MYDDIIFVLRDGWGDAQFRYWVQKHFMLVQNGETHVVYSTGKVSRPVVTYEELYTKLNECHTRVGHHGRDKTWEEVCTLQGVLSTVYGVQDFLDLRKYDFIDLRAVEPTTLPTITFTDA
ncbi:unnamed protein product, partial [Rotaria sp. Silwood1]